MAASLRAKALERSLKTNSAAYYSYLDDNKNPVLQSFEAQITDFKNYVIKQQRSNQTIDGRLSDTLFQLWSSFQPRISVRMYCEKLMHLGEFLVAYEKYNIALFQCYQRYLNEFGSFHMQDFETIDEIEEKFFPKGFSDSTADISFRALMGCALCLFYLAIEQDPKVQLDETLDRCLTTLSFIRLLMNLALKDDRWSWLIYNGTIYLYKMSRYLMVLGYGMKVLEYLVWAAVSTEMCLPLLSISYLPWRSTLYCAACEAFYDTRIAPDGEKAIAGENFARRALEQFKNLHELQAISIDGDTCLKETAFRTATIKVATMIFKRMVFENRRKVKGVLRPKVRQNYTDLGGAWPRTLTEKLLSDMFDCRCAQFLAILQALSDSNRRLMLAGPAAPEQEIEILDVTCELFYAAQYILQVKHANLSENVGANQNELYPNITLNEDVSLLDLSVQGKYVVPLSNVVQLFKYAFNYQVYEILEPLMEPVSELVERVGGHETALLALLQIFYEIEMCERERKAALLQKNQTPKKSSRETEKKRQSIKGSSKTRDTPSRKKSPLFAKLKMKKPKAVQDLLDAAKNARPTIQKETQQLQSNQMTEEEQQKQLEQHQQQQERSVEELLEDVCFLLLTDPFIHEKIEPDALIDISVLMWNKCRPILRKLYTEPNENQKWLTRLDHDHIKWVHLAFQTHEIMSRFNFAAVDSSAYAECSLRLGQILLTLIQPSSSTESVLRTKTYKNRFDGLLAHLMENEAKPFLKSYADEFKRQQTASVENQPVRDNKTVKGSAQTIRTLTGHDNALQNYSRQYPLVLYTEQFLSRSLKILAQARSSLIRFDGSSMFDRNWSSKGVEHEEDTDTLSQIRFLSSQPFQVEHGFSSKLMDNLVKDLDAELHFVYCRAAAMLSLIPEAKSLKRGPFEQYISEARSNPHKKALLCAAFASVKRDDESAAEYLQKAYKHLLAAEEEDRLYYCHYENQKVERISETGVPRPFIIARAPTFVFVMAPDFGPMANKIATYRIFCRAADRPNAKARMADTVYPGTGQQIPGSFTKPLKISGLDPDLKYVFSLALYDHNGQLIGESVSESTEPILAAHPISLLFVRSLLAQVSYEIKQFMVAKKVFHSLWTHFVRTPNKIESSIRQLSNENPLILYELRYSRIADSSISLLQKFINSIFIDLEIFIKENHLYCDMITPNSSNRAHQINRIRTCSSALIALEISCWLNDSGYALQSTIYLYGLLVPLIFSKIFYPSIYQIFEKCLSVLEEIAPHIGKQRSRVSQENIYHMVACVTYYMSQYLHQNDETRLSTIINQIGKKLLSPAATANVTFQTPAPPPPHEEHRTDIVSTTDNPAQQTLPNEVAEQVLPKVHQSTMHNEELKALERFVARERAPHSILVGNEEPSIVYTFINGTPSKQAYKEVQKFRKRVTYIEYLVQVVTKSITELSGDDLLGWYDDNQNFINKRNELLLGPWRTIITKSEGVIAIAGSNENKYAAALTEFSPERKKKLVNETPRRQGNRKQINAVKKMLKSRPAKYHLLIPAGIPENIRAEVEQRQKTAIDKLFNALPDLYHQRQARRKFRRFVNEELVWRSQYELLNGIYCVDRLPQVIRESNEKLHALVKDGRYRFDRLNPNIFTYDQTNLIVRNVNDDDILDDQTLERRFELNFSQIEVKDRVEVINDYILGQISDLDIYLSQKQDETGSSIRDRRQAPQNRQSQLKTKSPSISPRRDTTDFLYRQKTDAATDPFGFKKLRAYIDRFYLHFRRSIVFAYRSSNWTLLQNACKSLYDSMEQLMNHLSITSLNKIFTINALLYHGYQTLYLASESLIDMIHRTKPFYDNTNDKVVNSNTTRISQWFTDIESSWASATFNFEQASDRIISIDLRFVRKFILRSLHALYVSSKWEKLATVAMKFNAVSDHYFADLTSPMIIAAQMALLEQVRERQGSTDQPHFVPAVTELGRSIHPDDLFTLRPEKLYYIPRRSDENASRAHSASTISLGARLDPKGTDFYAQTNRALELISVPLDVECTRKLLRQALDKTYYASRSIMECRKMLAFYIHKQQESLAKDLLIFIPIMEDAEIQIRETTATQETVALLEYRPLTAGVPMDFSQKSKTPIEVSPSTEVTKETLLQSYQTLAKLLLGQNRRDQYCQIVTELGDLYFHFEQYMESKVAWCDVIDTMLDSRDVVTNWFKNDALKNLLNNSTQLLQKCGLWGCLMGSIVASKLAKYHIHINCDQHLQTCLLSSHFLRAVFYYTLPHSEHDIDYATLVLDNTIQLWPNINLTSDDFRLNPSAFMDALAYTCDGLVRHDVCLHILPVLVLYDVFALHCRNIQQTVQARLIRLRALIQLDLFHEAHVIIQMLLDGQKLPSSQIYGHYRSNFVDPTVAKVKIPYFDNSKSVLSDHNIVVLDSLINAKLSVPVSTLYGSHLSIEFHYLLSLFYVRLSSKIPIIADLDLYREIKQTYVTATLAAAEAKSKGSMTGSRIASPSKFKVYIFPDEFSRNFVSVKSYLVGTAKSFAEKCLKVLQQTDEMAREYPSNLQSFEYQLMLDCFSLLADCAHQCHLDQLAARYTMDTLKILSIIGDDNVNEQKVANGSAKRKNSLPRLSSVSRYPRKKLNAVNILSNCRYSHHLTVYTWLKQRAQLCYYMLQQINTVGKVKGSDDSIREELANVHTYIEHGYSESEQYRCESLQAKFLLYKALYNLSELVNIEQNIQRLRTASQLFQTALVIQQNNIPSIDIIYHKVLTGILLLEHESVHDLDGTIKKLIEKKENDTLQWPILDFFIQIGERVQTTNSSQPRDWFGLPMIPLNNIYSSLLLPLTFAKLRIATMIVDSAYRSTQAPTMLHDLFENSHTLFRQCLKLNRVSIQRYVNLDYECLLHLARIERLQKHSSLAANQGLSLKSIVHRLIHAMQLCYFSTNDSAFIQTCYFELALVLLEYSRTPSEKLKKSSIKSFALVDSNEKPASVSESDHQSVVTKSRQGNRNLNLTTPGENSRKHNNLKQAAAVAIRSATQMALNQKHRIQLPGLAEDFTSTNQQHWPTYLAGDILGYYIFPERRRIFKNDAEREVLTLAPHLEPKTTPESFDAKVTRLKSAAQVDITWLHLLNYQNAVARRLSNRQLLSFDCDAVGYSNLFFLHVFPRYVGVTQTLHGLSQYSAQCIPIYPSEIYSQTVLQIVSSSTDKPIQRASISSSRTLRSAQTTISAMNVIEDEHFATCPNIHTKTAKREMPDHQASAAFSLAWYSSSGISFSSQESQKSRSSLIYGFYTTAKDDLVDIVCLSLDQLLTLHKKYIPLAQVAETDAKHLNQNQMQGILDELIALLTGELKHPQMQDDEAAGKKIARLTEPRAYVELETFLNAKFGATTSLIQLRDWFVYVLKQASNTLLSYQD